MQNPSKVSQPKLRNPVSKKNKGNLPYLRFRRKLRKGMWG
jgi:hypothetical protein